MKPLAFIAGGSKGLGKALCQTYQHNGWETKEFSRSGKGTSEIVHINCDFSDVNLSNDIFKKSFETHNRDFREKIQLIINAASLSPFGNIAEAKTQDIIEHLNININTATILIHQFNRIFQSHPAEKKLAYISSGAARRSIEGMALYCASKAALERLVLTINEEQKHQEHPIQSMVINPGVMDTDMQTLIRKQNKKDFPLVNHWTALHSDNKLAQVEIVAKICHKIINQTQHQSGYYIAQDHI